MGKLNCRACSEKQCQSEIIKDEHEHDNNADEQGEGCEEEINNKQVPIKNIPMLSYTANINNGNDFVGLDNNINSAQTTHPNNPNDESNDNDDNNNNNQLNEGDNDNDNENNVNTPTENNNPQQVHKQRKLPKKTKTLTSNNIMNRKMPLEIIDERHCETISPHRGGYYVSPYKHNPFSTMHNASDNVNPATSSPNINSVGNFNNKEHNESNSSLCDSSVLAKHKKWYEYEIREIINEEKLNNTNNNKDDVLLHNDLYKVNITNSRKKIKYTVNALVFVVITKEGMKVFRTKGNFLFNKKPLYEIKFGLIRKCGVVGEEGEEKVEMECKKGKRAFYVDIVNENVETDNNDVNNDGDDVKEEEESQNVSLNEENKRKGKKMKMIEPRRKELNNVKSEGMVNKKKVNDIQGGVLPKRIVFVSQHKDIVNKWVCVINYFIAGHKGDGV